MVKERQAQGVADTSWDVGGIYPEPLAIGDDGDLKGDGIGPEIMDAVLMIFKANKVGLEYEVVDMGK